MDPSAINELTRSAKELHHTKRKGSPEAFILSWIAWEGMKLRILAVAQKKIGIKIKDTYLSHKDLNLWSEEKFDRQWRKAFGKNPSNMSGAAGKVFREMKKYKKYRDKFAHGKEFGNPKNVDSATVALLKNLEDKDWLKDLFIVANNKSCSLYELFERERK